MGPTDVELVFRLDDWFDETLRTLSCRDDTRAYVISVLSRYGSNDDMSHRSVVLAYSEARERCSFVTYQKIGDWVLWVSSVYPNAISSNKDLVHSIGRASYKACNALLKGSWPLYEELADNLPIVARRINFSLEKRNVDFR